MLNTDDSQDMVEPEEVTDDTSAGKPVVSREPKSRHALIVEDSNVIRRLLVSYMKAFNFKCWEAENGVIALKVLKEMGSGFFDIVLTDLMMPQMGGIEFVANCREKYKEDFPPIVVCSTKSDKVSVKTVISLNIDGYIVKPFKVETIRAKLASLFNDIPEHQ